ncbi:MAG: hypothetical protein N3C63_01970 [Rhodocyclaceae bacterium]|nr:hypothetical protein [Rhodocyclaceae bacterium]
MTDQHAGSTNAAPPAPDWNQARQTVLMLELAAGQVEAAMKDSNSSVEVLTDSFTSLVDTLQLVEAAIDTLPDTIGNGLVKQEIQSNTRFIGEKIRQAIVAFQFYDRLVQRLDHVCRGLDGLAELLADPARKGDPAEWRALQEKILAKYTLAEERAMFDAVLAGTPVQEALKHYLETRLQEIKNRGGEIELF